jgi:sensor histidine kinase regulating citrate/malate metabolism
MVMLARDNPVLVTDGETITFLNAQALELFKSIDPEADFIGQPISDFVTKFCPSFASRVNVHRAEEEELEFSVVIHRHQLPAFGSEPFYAVIARGGVSGGE